MTRSRRHNCSMWLAVRCTFVSASSLWSDQSLKIPSSCCFKLSCPKKSFRPISELDGRAAESFMGPSLLKVRCKLLFHMQLQERYMRRVRFAHAVYTDRDLEEIIGRFLHMRMKKHCGSPKLKANYSPIAAWHVSMWQSVRLITAGEEEKHSRRSENHNRGTSWRLTGGRKTVWKRQRVSRERRGALKLFREVDG